MDINEAMRAASGAMISSIGMDATYYTAAGETTTITVLFDEQYQTVDLESGSVESSGPAAHCVSADVEDAAHGETLTVGTTDYTITGIEPDGTGVTVLRLHKA